MKKYLNCVLLVFYLLLVLSCGPKELSIRYSNTCFNEDNEIVYIKSQAYKYFSISLPDSMESWESYRYLCKTDLCGNEKVLEIIPPEISYSHLSEGNGKFCIQTHYYEVYTYVSGEFRKVFENGHETKISFNGEKIAYTKKENDTFTLCISNVDGTDVNKFGECYMRHWHPSNNQIIYTKNYEWVLLDITTSNTQTLPYGYRWSHDLQRIAYYDEDNHLVLMNEDETGKVVTDWVDRDRRIEWSYDGEYLLSDFHLLDKNGNLIRTLRERD